MDSKPSPSGRYPHRYEHALALLLATLTFGLSLLYGIVTPLWEGTDEPIHFDFIKHVADYRRLPTLYDEGAVLGQTLQPPLYYVLSALTILDLDTSNLGQVRQQNPWFFGLMLGEEHNYAIHSEAEGYPYRGAAQAVHRIRALTALWGALTVLATYWTGREFWPRGRAPALTAAAIVGFTPSFILINSVITNDSLSITLSAWTVWLTLRTVRLGVTPRRAIGVGILSGLSLLTKQSAIFLVPVVGLALLYACRRSWRALSGHVVELVLPVLLLVGWWYVWNWRLYGDPWGAQIYFYHYGRPDFPPFSWGWLWAEVVRFHEAFWARFGWNIIRADSVWYAFYAGVTTLGGLGWAIAVVRRRVTRTFWAVPWCILSFVMNVAWLLIFSSRMGLVGVQPRYLYPTFPALAVLLAGGLTLLVPGRRAMWLRLAICGVMGIVALAAPFAYILPAFAQR